MPRYALILGYIPDITYTGFNHQLHDPANMFTLVCRALNKARLVKSEDNVTFASRTDRGVGALNQVIAFDSVKSPIVPEINSYLPSGIQILGQTSVSHSFNPRKDALLRAYSYFLVINDDFNLKQLKESFNTLRGTHNFQNFAKTDTKNPKNPTKTITETSLIHLDHDILHLRISSQSFLWQQVRRIVGHLIEVATTELNLSDTLTLLNDQTIRKKPPSAPPEGLILEKIEYKDFSFSVNEKSLNSFQKILSDNVKHYRGQLAVTKYLLDSLSKY
ncbi:MAG: tRNA pseudouridine synthase A [Candidatus Hodarchaeales archaeon]|jgi:tRNA pseudouridine38-40 synthase